MIINQWKKDSENFKFHYVYTVRTILCRLLSATTTTITTLCREKKQKLFSHFHA